MPRVVLTEEQRNEIASKYESDTSTNLANEYGCSRATVLKIWRERGLKGKDKSRKYYCNFNYFENMDTPDKAYFVGFIAADGCIFSREGHQKLLSIILSESDIEVLENFKRCIESNQPIKQIKQTGNRQDTVSLQITSDKLCDDLAQYNIIERKTWTYVPAGVPDDLFCHFLRGYFDGDGSIFNQSSENNKEVCLVGNKDTMSFFKEHLSALDIEGSLSQDKREYTDEFYSLRFTHRKDRYQFLKYIYPNENVLALSRKKEKVLEFIEYCESRQEKQIKRYGHSLQ